MRVMTVIAIDGQPSSHVNQVATMLAERLRLTLVEDHLIAERIEIDPALVDSQFKVWSPGLHPWSRRRKSFLSMIAATVLELASNGDVVIPGWGAPQILRSVGHVIRVYVGSCGRPLHSCKWLNWSSRGHREWRGNYDIVFAANISAQTCVEQIQHLAQKPEFEETAVSLAALARLREASVRATASRSYAFLEVELGLHRLRLPGNLTADERIARVEMDLRGRKPGGDWRVPPSLPVSTPLS
jgi:hypothetical protein